MAEMDRHTGDLIDDELAAIEQSVTDILTTLVGTRIERRDYGSVLPLLIDQPLTEATLLRVYSAAIIAIQQWEPRIRIEHIRRHADARQPGRARLAMRARTRAGNAALALATPLGSA